MKEGLIVVLSAPAGSGKGTVREIILKRKSFFDSVSVTTRAMRPGDKEGDYEYVSEEEFFKRRDADFFLECNQYCNGKYYGTPKAPALEAIARGEDVLLEIDVNGGLMVKEKYPNAVLIMLLSPNATIQEKRLRGRKSETEESIAARLAETPAEVGRVAQYDYLVYNHEDGAEACAEEILSIIAAEHARTRYYPNAAEDYYNN